MNILQLVFKIITHKIVVKLNFKKSNSSNKNQFRNIPNKLSLIMKGKMNILSDIFEDFFKTDRTLLRVEIYIFVQIWFSEFKYLFKVSNSCCGGGGWSFYQ